MKKPDEQIEQVASKHQSSSSWIERATEFGPSTISLVIANAIPLLGVIFLGWSTFAVVAIYWAENVVIGILNVFKIVFANPDLSQVKMPFVPKTGEQRELMQQLIQDGDQSTKLIHGMKFFLVPFFIFHYGLFCTVHGVFVMVLLGGNGPFDNAGPDPSQMFRLFTEEHLWWGVGALAVSHTISFFVNYIGKDEYRKCLPIFLMFQPYVRIVVLHIAILIGAFAVIALGSPMLVVILLIFGKTVLDLGFHVREHDRPTNAPTTNSLSTN